MYLRLWWKDARQLWSIWVFVALAAAVGQWVALNHYGPGVRQGPLLAMALAWSVLYAVVAGSAAFAGERETGTLRLLDILPAARPVVWAGKFSFALITTMALTALLFTMAAFSTENVGYFDGGSLLFKGDSKSLLGVCLGLVVLVALAWGLFWSSILSNALTAAIATAGSTAICMIYLMAKLEEVLRWLRASPRTQIDIGENPFVIFEIVVILATLVASNLLFTRGSRRRRLPFQFQSPVVMTPADPDQRGWVTLRRPSRVAPATVPRVAEATTSDQSPRRSRLAEARALIWETRQEGATTWSLLAVLGMAVPLPFYLAMGDLDPSLLMLLDTIIALVAGINVFGMENRARTQRFLTHHGARPGLVWLAKLAVWCVGLAAIWGPQAIIAQRADLGMTDLARESWQEVLLVIPLAFAVALLCGMTISRGLTAAVIALVMTLALEVPQLALVRAVLLPIQGLLVIPVALLFISWAWSGDWLLDRPAPGRWLRLGSLLTGTLAVLLVFYAGFRAWSVPDIGPIAQPRAWVAQSDPLRADLDLRNRDTAAIYRQVVQSLKSQYPGLDLNDEALGLVRRAVAQPDPFGKVLRDDLARLLIRDARDRLGRGDLAVAWTDLINVFRMVRDQADEAGIAPATNSLLIEREALDLAMEWAVAARQTPEQLRSALAAIRDLPKMTPADDVIRAEANLTEKALDLPAKELGAQLESIARSGLARTGEFGTAAWLDWFTTPWERARARRVTRLLASSAIQNAVIEPWRRARMPPRPTNGRGEDLPYELASTPLAKLLVADTYPYLQTDDWNEVGRRALVQVLAIRDWQLRHNGQFPDALERLVPEELPRLLIDPYSGRTFGYVRSEGQPLVLLGKVLGSFGTGKMVQTTGYWLLSSVGRNDNKGTVVGPYGGGLIFFPIPPVQSGGGVDKKR
jgi:ABC-type transport system involved in multi-copper enzyme maturation permease subunit